MFRGIRERSERIPHSSFISSLNSTAQPVNVPKACSSGRRMRFLEARTSMSAKLDDSIPFVDMGEASLLGSLLLTAWSRNYNFENRRIGVGVNDTHPTDVYLVPSTLYDLTGFVLSVPLPPFKSYEIVFWDSDITDIDQRSYLIATRSIRSLLKRLALPPPEGSIRGRYLRPGTISDQDDFTDFVQTLNDRLDSPLEESHQTYIQNSDLNVFKFYTYGQMILAIFIITRSVAFSDRKCGLPIRIMFLWLESFVALSDPADALYSLDLLYRYLQMNDDERCHSCLERALLIEIGEGDTIISYPYVFESFMTSAYRYMAVKPTRELRYEIKKHEVPDRQACLSWKYWEHTFVTPAFARCTMTFQLRCVDGSMLDILVSQHWGMSLIQCLHFLQKGLKGAVYGRGNKNLITSVQEKGFDLDDNAILKEMIVDVLLIGPAHPMLENLAVNVAGLMILCLIPSNLVHQVPVGQRGVDYYDSLVRNMFLRKLDICSEIYDCFRGLGANLCLERLNSEDMKLTMCHYHR